MSVVSEARDEAVADLRKLEPGSDAMLKHAQVVKILTEADNLDRRLEFEVEKEETRKMEKSNEYISNEYDRQLRWVELGIRALDVILNPSASLIRTFANNKVRIKRDVMGYQYEETGVIGSHTFNNAQKDKYD